MTNISLKYKELQDFIDSLVGTPYKDEPPFSLEHGFNCFSFASYLWGLFSKENYELHTDFTYLRALRNDFIKLNKESFQLLDIPLFNNVLIEVRHIGVMLDNNIMIHCSSATNGVARSDIRRKPWCINLKAVYRHKSLV